MTTDKTTDKTAQGKPELPPWAVCPNCGQYQHMTNEGYRDCVNDCAEHKLAPKTASDAPEAPRTYPVVDRLNETERKKFGVSISDSLPLTTMNMPVRGGIKAIYIGEKRNPKAGEWYLSGAIVEAYKAPNDLSTPYRIAKLVKVERITTERIVQ